MIESPRYRWRVWLAFETRPGITRDSINSGHWKALAGACRLPNGKINLAEFEYWRDCFVDNSHLWGQA